MQIKDPEDLTKNKTSYVLKNTINFIVQSAYFSPNYSKDNITLHSHLLQLPKAIHFNNPIIITTDKTIMLPTLPEELESIDKTSLQIQNESIDNNLKYMFYIPVSDDKEKDKLLTGKNVLETQNEGQIISVQVPDGDIEEEIDNST
jgi:hypothetical protein